MCNFFVTYYYSRAIFYKPFYLMKICGEEIRLLTREGDFKELRS